MTKKIKKIVASILLLIITVPQISQAQFNIDIANQIKEYGLDTLAYVLASTAGTKLANKIFNKANGGASGNDNQPSFVSDFNSYFADLERTKVQKFVTDLEVSQNPFAQNIARSMIFAYSAAGGPGIPDDIGGFNLDTILGDRWEDFYDDASIGGYDGLLAMSIPGNTAIGSSLLAEQQLGRTIERARENEMIKLTSPGTLPQQRACSLNFSDYANQIKTIKAGRNEFQSINPQQTETGGDTTALKMAKEEIDRLNALIREAIQEQMLLSPKITTLAGRVQEAKNAGDEPRAQQLQIELSILRDEYKNWGTDIDNYNAQLKDVRELQGYVSGIRNTIATNTQALVEDFGRCLVETIQNPLGLVSSGLESATNIAMDNIKNLDEIGEIAAGIFISMANSFLQNGLASLRADYRQSPPAVGGPEQLQSVSGGTVNWTQAPVNVVDLRSDFSLALEYTEQELKLIQEYISIIGGKPLVEVQEGGVTQNKSFPKLVSELSACVPGPDFDFVDKIDKYVQTQTRNLEAKLASGRGNENKQENREEAKDIIETAVPLAKAEVEVWMSDPERNIPGAFTFQSQTNKLIDVQKVYGKKRTDLIKKQTALNVLKKLRNDIRQSFALIPAGIIPQSIQSKIVFSPSEWKLLPQADKTEILNWVRSSNPATLIPESEQEQYQYAMNHVWNIWENPEGYFRLAQIGTIEGTSLTASDYWNFGQPSVAELQQRREQILGTAPISRSELFLEKKNQIRTEYNAVVERVSIKRDVDQSELDVNELRSITLDIQDNLHDCELLRTITNQNIGLIGNPTSPVNKNAHEQLRQILIRRQGEFKTDVVRLGIQNGSSSILTTDPTRFPEDMIESGQCVNPTTGPCYQDTGIQENRSSSDRYQVQPARNIWEIFLQDPGRAGLNRHYLCPFSVWLLEIDDDRGTKKNGELRCKLTGGSQWYTTKESEVVSYIFKDSFTQ